MPHRPVEGDSSPRVLRGEESRLGLRPGESQRFRVRQECEGIATSKRRNAGPADAGAARPPAPIPAEDQRAGFRGAGGAAGECRATAEGIGIVSRSARLFGIRMPARLRQEDVHQPQPSKIVDRPGGIRGEGADQFDREAVRRCGREETRAEAADRGCRGRVENEAGPLVLQPDRANDPERIFPEPVRRFPHATDPFPAHVFDAAEGIEQPPITDEAAGGEPEEESVDREVPPRRVVDGLLIVGRDDRTRGIPACPGTRPPWPSSRRPRPLRARAPAGACGGDVDVLLPPFDRDPVHREMPARRHDLPDARHLTESDRRTSPVRRYESPVTSRSTSPGSLPSTIFRRNPPTRYTAPPAAGIARARSRRSRRKRGRRRIARRNASRIHSVRFDYNVSHGENRLRKSDRTRPRRHHAPEGRCGRERRELHAPRRRRGRRRDPPRRRPVDPRGVPRDPRRARRVPRPARRS